MCSSLYVVGCTIDYVRGDVMVFKGFIKQGMGIDSKRDNWDDVKDFFDFEPYKGTLNVSLDRSIKLENLNCDFKIFNKFNVVKGIIKSNDKKINVYLGYKEEFPRVIMFFIISHLNLRNELKLEDGDTVEVIL